MRREELGEDIAAQIGAELPGLGVGDPCQCIPARGVDRDIAAVVEPRAVGNEDENGVRGGRLGGRVPREADVDARRRVKHCDPLTGLDLELVG